MTDKSEKGHNGRIAGARWTPEGKIGGGCEVGRSMGYIETPDNEAWSFPRKDFGICLWIRLKADSRGEQMFIGHDDGGGECNKWAFELLNGNINFHVNTLRSESYRIANCPWQPELGRWYHLAVARKADSFAIYVDGTIVSTDTNRLPLPDVSAPLTIGQAEGLYVNGMLDEVMIFDRTLSAAEVKALYNARKPLVTGP